MSESRQHTSRRTRKIAAIAAGLLVVGVGATYTLASWTDSEWVWGGAGGDDLIGTSKFNLEQNTTSNFALESNDWVDSETNPGDQLVFSPGAVSLAPEDSVYAPVALRTAADSVAATVNLKAAVQATGIAAEDDGSALWNAIDLAVYTSSVTAPDVNPIDNCDADFDSTGWLKIVDGKLANAGDAPQSLTAKSGSVQHYCFVLTLPADAEVDFQGENPGETLQGRKIAPAWEFSAVSN